MSNGMSAKMSRWGVAALAALGLAAGSCSCAGEVTDRLEPKLEFEGSGVGTDPLAKAHYAIDFGMVAVGSTATPEVFAFNAGNAKLTGQVENASEIPLPFKLASGNFDLGPKERKKLEFSISPREVGSFETTITIRTNEKDKLKTIRLMGQGIRSELVCTPSEVQLGDVVKGETRSGQATCTNHLSIPTTIQLGGIVGSYQKYFKAELQGGNGTQAEIPAGGSIDIAIEFHADNVSGAATVTLPILDEGGQTMVSLPIHANAVEHALQVRYEEDGERIPLVGCYRFPDTDIEMEDTRSLFVRNLSRKPIHLEDLRLDKDNDHYSIISPQIDGPLLVPADGADDVEIQIAFHPKTAQKHTQHLIIQSDDDLAPVGGIRACMEGQGGGSRISCTPGNINFGPVAIGMSVTREYTCENTAQLREGVPPQVLFVDRVETTVPNKFTAVIVNPDGSQGPSGSGYQPNEGFKVLVTYTPGPLEGFDSAEVVVHNFSSATPEHLTQVVGQGRELPPCVFDVSPPSLRFGVVAPGSQRTLTSYVVNHLDTECIISNLRLGPGTDPAYSMDEVESAIIEGGERFPITVTFAPTDYANSLIGTAEFYISDPTNPEQSIALSGISQKPCLEFHPETIDFGAAPPHCAGREVFVSMANTCATSVQIEDIYIDEAYPQFVLYNVPLFPLEIKAGDRKDFSAYFRPDDEGTFIGNITVEVSDLGDGTQAPVNIGPYTIPMEGVGSHEAIQTDSYTQNDAAKVDVLWVMDNSGSMSGLQTIVNQNVQAFMGFAVEQGIDFHVGITTSGVSYATSSGCPGGFNGNEDGRLFPHPDLGRPRILKSSMPRDQLYHHFAENVKVGTCHGSEAMYEAARRALSHPWINTPEAEGGNKGFLRTDAALSIIGVTDENDVDSRWEGSTTEPRDVARYVEFFQSLKPSRARADGVKVHFISGGQTSCSGNGSAMACPRCVEGPNLTGGVWLEICRTDSWDDALREMAQGAFGFDTAFGLRGQPADQTGDGRVDHEDIDVRVNGRRRPAYNASGARVWRYNAQSNSIAFDVLHVPGANQLIEVTYKVACINYD